MMAQAASFQAPRAMLPTLKLEEDDEGELIWEEASRKVALPPLGRILNTIFASECRDLEKALLPDNVRAQQGSVGRAVRGLLQHVETGLITSASLDQIHIPLLEHAVKSKDHGNRRKIVAIFRWLFANSKLGVLLAKSLATIAEKSQGDHRVQLGWCIVVRELVEKEPLLYNALSDGQAEKRPAQIEPPLMSFRACVHPLVEIVCSASVKEGKQKVPTRLTMAAADCVLVITKGLVSDPPHPTPTEMTKVKEDRKEEKRLITPTISLSFDDESGRENGALISDNETEASTSGRMPQAALKDQGARTLWDNLDDIIRLISELQEWNERGRTLHAQGLQQVQKRLNFLARFRDSLQTQDGEQEDFAVGVSVLAACWRQFGGLMLLEDRTLSANPEPVIEHWLGALQYWTQEVQELAATESRRADEMRGYALTCLALVVGRLDPRRLDAALEDVEPQLLQTLMNQVRGSDNEIVDIAMAILRALLFRKPSALREGTTTAAAPVTSKMEEIVPVLMDMLDARDSAARAVVLLVAEFFASNPTSPELEKVFARLDSEDALQRRNGLDVVAELLAITTKSEDSVDSPLSRTVAAHLFDRLGDEELTNRVEASALFAKLDSSFTLAPLVRLVYSPDAQKRSAASSAIEAVLIGHSDQGRTVTVLLDCLRDLMADATSGGQSAPAAGSKKEEASLDLDRVLRLLPAWAAKVQDWEPLVRVLLDKMYTEASNPVIPRFLSHISDQLSRMPHLGFPQIHQRMQEQPKMSEELLNEVSDNEDTLGQLLFQRLSPMLALRVLHLQAFNFADSMDLYGGLLSDPKPGLAAESAEQSRGSTSCITTLLLERMCGSWELDDVRKIASELTGRLLPNAMLPLVSAALENAAATLNTVTAKACLFSLCTSLMIRGKETLDHPLLARVQNSLSVILLWSGGSVKGPKEIAKAQHGCIDCFAAMVCAEVGTVGTAARPPSFPTPRDQKPKKLIEEIPESEWRSRPKGVNGKEGLQKQWKVLSSVVDYVTGHRPSVPFSALLGPSGSDEGAHDAHPAPEVFRICMANVLISASEKLSPSARPAYAKAVIPPIMHFIQVGSSPKLRGACLQVLFTSVYHLKGTAMAPFATDLLHLSISTIGGRHSTEERVAGAKLLASLLAGEDEVLGEIAPFLEDARRAVATVANMDASPQLRALCEQLLACMTATQ